MLPEASSDASTVKRGWGGGGREGPYCKYNTLGVGVRTVVISTKGGENECLALVFGGTY
jgi:hypothetical protein